MRNLWFGVSVECSALTALALILACVNLVLAQDFGYGGQHGPEHWGEDYKRCSGKFQSPINFDVQNVVQKTFPALEYFNFDVTPKAIHMTNNGHTVLVTMSFEKGKEPRVRGGPLERQSDYQFEQFHFHWGENDTIGSEDLINNQAYPAELHVVMRSLDYPDFKSALGQDHGIAVMAYLFRVAKKDNPYYGEFVEMLSTISQNGNSSDLVQPLPLKKFLSTDIINYFSYNGSLTTPPCTEEVVWIDYFDTIDISEHQLNHFRALTANDDHLKNNFRPIQPLNDRVVYQNYPKLPDVDIWSAIPFVDAENAAGSIASGGLVALLGFNLFILLKDKILVAFN